MADFKQNVKEQVDLLKKHSPMLNWLGNYVQAPGGLPADIRKVGSGVGNFVSENPLPILGAGAATVAAPFTGGASMLALPVLAGGGWAMGEAGQAVVNNQDNILNYLKGSNPEQANNASQPQGMLEPPAVNGTGGIAPTPANQLLAAPNIGGLIGTGQPSEQLLANLGPANPEGLTPPQMVLPTGTDFGPIRERFAAAAPTDISPEDKQKMAWANMIGSWAQGATQGDTFSERMLNAGLNSLAGVAGAKLQQVEDARKQKLAEQEFALKQADLELDIARQTANDENALREVEYKNQLANYNYSLAMFENAQPKVLNASQYGVTYMMTDASGNRVLRQLDTGLTDKLINSKIIANALGDKKDGVDLATTKMAISADPVVGALQSRAVDLEMGGELDNWATQAGISEELNDITKQSRQEGLMNGLQGNDLMAKIRRDRINAVVGAMMQATENKQ